MEERAVPKEEGRLEGPAEVTARGGDSLQFLINSNCETLRRNSHAIRNRLPTVL